MRVAGTHATQVGEGLKGKHLSCSRKSIPLPISFLHQHATVMIKRYGPIGTDCRAGREPA